jgi:hypothetical protein
MVLLWKDEKLQNSLPLFGIKPQVHMPYPEPHLFAQNPTPYLQSHPLTQPLYRQVETMSCQTGYINRTLY